MIGNMDDGLAAHLKTGLTTLCHAWAIRRRDGAELTFTDHDAPLSFGGLEFRPDRGLNVRALSHSTGLSVNNTEAMGALSQCRPTNFNLSWDDRRNSTRRRRVSCRIARADRSTEPANGSNISKAMHCCVG